MPTPFIGYPQVRAHFFTAGTQFVRVGRAQYIKQPRSPQILDDRHRDAVLSVTTMKDLSAPAGRWSVTMTAADYDRGGGTLDLLRLGDLCVIEMGPDKPQPTDTFYSKNYTKGLAGTEIVMIGAVDAMEAGEAFTPEGHVTRTVTVSGRDFGRHFVDDALWWDAWSDPYSSILALQTQVDWPKLTLFGQPGAIIASVISHWVFGQFNVTFNMQARANSKDTKQQRQLSEILRFALAADAPEIPYGSAMMSYEGALWNLFESVVGAPFYHLVLDVRRQNDITLLLKPHAATTDNGATANMVWNTDLGHFNSQVCLLYRRNPWSNRFYDDWALLPTRVITDTDVLSSHLGRSTDQVYNVWRALASVPERTRIESVGALTDSLLAPERDLFQRFGPRPRIVEVPFYRSASAEGVFDLVKRFTAQLRDWDIHNEHLLAGEITFRGMAAVKAGDRLWWRKDDASQGIDFYVEGVEQNFQALTSWTTTVQVTRGQLHRDQRQPLFDANGNTVRSPAIYGGAVDLTETGR